MSAQPGKFLAHQSSSVLFRLCLLGFLVALVPACEPQLSAQSPESANSSAANSAAQANLTGYWVFRVPNQDGTSRSTYFQLEQSGEAVKGSLLVNRRTGGVALNGTFTGNHLHLTTTPAPRPAETATANPPAVTTIEGTLEDGKLNLQVTARQRTNSGVAERTTKEATMPPAALPLPALTDLPDNNLVRTPPMGWNSWNKFAGRITDADVRAMADTIVSSGMAKAGYTYVNIDDTWELGRDAQGNITSNKKFPDMKALGDYVHSKGLKFGIYSSPGPTTCGGYMASYGHEAQDAKTFASWGVDYLKYDLCSAREIYPSTPETLQGIYQKMGDALQQTGRPIVYSLCEYGDGDVWKWGSKTGGNLWRTTGDISDHWASMDKIGFSQIDISPYIRAGHWNDPDMLEIGNGGMTADEYRTHMSLWSMLAAPLIAGNDLATMTDETKSILMNTDVIAVDQDSAAKPVQMLAHEGTTEVLMRPMADGSLVIGLFNRGTDAAPVSFQWKQTPMTEHKHGNVRDLWQHQDVKLSKDGYTATVPSHGVVLLRIAHAK